MTISDGRSLLLQEHFRLDTGLLEDGAQGALRHVAGVVRDGGVAVGGRVMPDLVDSGGLAMKLHSMRWPVMCILIWSLRRLGAMLLVVATGLLLASCIQGGENAGGAGLAKATDIVAGYGEKSFAQKSNLKIMLPMPETEFLALLDRLKLHYGVCGEHGTRNELPAPRQKSTVDFSKAIKCFEIDGDVDQAQHIGERYRAFSDSTHHVFYIENAFSYTGP